MTHNHHLSRKITPFSILALLVLNTAIYAELWAPGGYEEIPQPSIVTCKEGMITHQRQWYYFHLYTMNLDVPGYIEDCGYNMNKNGHIIARSFYRKRGGVPQETNNPLDFAVDIADRGFFCIRLKDGHLAYTRDGRFRLDSNRKLITLTGRFAVLNENGNEIVLPDGKDITCSKSGVLFVNNAPVDKLGVAVFVDDQTIANKLEKISGTILVEKGRPEKVPNAEYAVLQGYVNMNGVLKALTGDGLMWKYGNEASAKAARSQIKLLTSAVQMANP